MYVLCSLPLQLNTWNFIHPRVSSHHQKKVFFGIQFFLEYKFLEWWHDISGSNQAEDVCQAFVNIAHKIILQYCKNLLTLAYHSDELGRKENVESISIACFKERNFVDLRDDWDVIRTSTSSKYKSIEKAWPALV